MCAEFMESIKNERVTIVPGQNTALSWWLVMINFAGLEMVLIASCLLPFIINAIVLSLAHTITFNSIMVTVNNCCVAAVRGTVNGTMVDWKFNND